MASGAIDVCKQACLHGMADAPGQWQPAMVRRLRALLATDRKASLGRRRGGQERSSGSRAVRERGITAAARSVRRWRRNLAMPSGSRTSAITLVRPPQCSQVSRSMANVRRSNSTKGRYFERCVDGGSDGSWPTSRASRRRPCRKRLPSPAATRRAVWLTGGAPRGESQVHLRRRAGQRRREHRPRRARLMKARQ